MSTSARKIEETFNGRREWMIGGAGYFKLLDTVSPVELELYLEGRQRLVASQVEGGFYQRVGFDRVVITTGASEVVAWIFGPDEGGSDRFTGVVSVSDDATRLLGVVSDAGVVYGASYSSLVALVANTAVQVVAPASNLNGIIVWRASMVGGSAGGTGGGLLAKASAPANLGDGDPIMMPSTTDHITGDLAYGLSLDRPIKVPVGKGLYFIATATETVTSNRSVLYTIL